MSGSVNIRKWSLTMAIVVAIIAVAIPVCQMIACDMTGATPYSPLGAAFTSACSGFASWTAPASLVAEGMQSFMLALVAMLGMALVLFVPVRREAFAHAAAAEPPPPPEDPRGVKLLI